MKMSIVFIYFFLPLIAVAQQLPVPANDGLLEAQLEAAGPDGNREAVVPEEDLLLDLNTTDITEILSSALFTTAQAGAILQHREKFGRFIAVEELQVVNGIEAEQLRRMKPFLRCGQALVDEHFYFNELLAAARHEILIRGRRELHNTEGFSNDGNYPFYRGDPNQFYFRYRTQAGRYFSAGIVMEKDAGETFLSRSSGGRMDFFSWHVYLKPDRILETLAVGDFQVQFGQGLVAWQGLSMGKSNEVQQFYRRGAGIRPYASSGESGFNRGLACTLHRGKWKFDGWISFLKRDASLFPADTTFTRFFVSSIAESGLHRSADEIKSKAQLSQFTTGSHLQWQNNRFRQEFTWQYQQFDLPLWPGDDPYEKYDPAGEKFSNIGWATRYLFPNATIFSEVAIDAQLDPALLAGLLFMPDPRWTISLHYRNFDKRYQCIGCDALREGTKVQNEQGFLAGIIWQITSQLKGQGYLDYFHFPWLRFSSSAPIYGKEWLSQLTYTPDRNTEIYIRFKREEKPSDALATSKKMPFTVIKNNMRLNVQWMHGRNWEFQARCEWVGVRPIGPDEAGVLFFQEFRYKPMGKAYSIAFRWSVFNTESYDSRIYSYEQDMAGAFSLPANAGKGYRYYILSRYRLRKGLDIWLRYGSSVFPQGEIEEDETDGKKEFKVQIRWQF